MKLELHRLCIKTELKKKQSPETEFKSEWVKTVRKRKLHSKSMKTTSLNYVQILFNLECKEINLNSLVYELCYVLYWCLFCIQ